MRIIHTLIGLALLSSCGEAKQPGPIYDGPPTPPPATAAPSALPAVSKLVLQPIRMADAVAHDLTGFGCTFVVKGEPQTDWAVITGFGDAHIKLGGVLVKFTADETTREMGYLTREIYKGDGRSIQLRFDPGDAKPVGNEGEERPGSVTIRDGSGATVYQAQGMFNCGA